LKFFRNVAKAQFKDCYHHANLVARPVLYTYCYDIPNIVLAVSVLH